ncbi:MAG: hypothetical protein KJ607_05060 [Bacteroidetes bacterium]|nr:hypothetical protein [Bacteroidota bacterium]
MLIANPIYDTVFKYMMDDNKVAKLLLSAIIGEKITKLELRPTGIKTHIKDTLTVYYIDFVAKIRSEDRSERLVIIEVQKAKFATDIMRFRKYLGEQYSNPNNVYEVNEPNARYGKALPIVSIYFLGHRLDHTKAPVIKIQREYLDVTTGKEIKEKEYFIESLTHDSYIIQIPFLEQNRKTELLRILSIFDQSSREENYHILNVREEDFSVRYRHIIRRLQQAHSDNEVRKHMQVEDNYLDYLENQERYIADMIELKDRTIEEKNKTIKDITNENLEIKKQFEELKRRLDNK